MGKNLSKNYYCEPVKVIRDLVHEYVSITKFELTLIDTVWFQRLKDIRQLTCQEVYSAARHTRFEHSLGVLELTRQAVKHLNKNQTIPRLPDVKIGIDIIDDNLQFNAALAALLHDVGHCPFSHLGEVEFDADAVLQRLHKDILEVDGLKDSPLAKLTEKRGARNLGAVHEQLSCIVILEKYREKLSKLDVAAGPGEVGCDLEVDYEFLIRCILGLEYDVSNKKLFQENKVKNAIVRLINSSIFDMDKLDYIMRDSTLTGIGTPKIDTKRLFRNMYFSREYTLVFTSKAVPALQNMIEARDGLYMYVYNHHTVVFSDFMNAYILRRLSHNYRDFAQISGKMESGDAEELLKLSVLGMTPVTYLFSARAVVEQSRSDSDWVSLLNLIRACSIQHHFLDDKDWWREDLHKRLSEMLGESQDDPGREKAEDYLVEGIERAVDLIHNYRERKFLKPWWKTIFEFSNFMHTNFRDDKIRKQLCEMICKGGKYGLEASELRSQIAKVVIYITQELWKSGAKEILEELKDGEFFIVERSNRFFAPDTIEKLDVALKISEILGSPTDVNYQTPEYYVKNLTNIIPQKDYSSIYAKDGFYIYSKPLGPEQSKKPEGKRHYKLIERIFVFVSTEFMNRGEQEFIRIFGGKNSGGDKTAAEALKKEMLDKFQSSDFP